MAFWTSWRRKAPAQAVAHTPAQLFHLPQNPMPDGMTAWNLTTADGKRIRYARLRTAVTPFRGTVIMLHGRNECIEKYFETAGDFARAGYDVVTFDWRGQGYSERLIKARNRGHVRRFSDYARDLDAIFDEVVLPDCRAPFFILAHSTGALIALDNAPRLKSRVERMVLLSPFLGLTGRALSTPTAGAVARTLTLIGLGQTYFGGGPHKMPPFEQNKVTSDRGRHERGVALYQRYPHLALASPTAQWFAEATRAMARIERREQRSPTRLPSLFIVSGADSIVDSARATEIARELPAAHVLTIDHARHELLQEADVFRGQAIAAAMAFLPGTGPASARAGLPTAWDLDMPEAGQKQATGA